MRNEKFENYVEIEAEQAEDSRKEDMGSSALLANHQLNWWLLTWRGNS